MVARPFNGSSSPRSRQSEALKCVFEEAEWEIAKIVDKRRVRQGYEYEVHWKRIWLPKSELGNA